jgi:hypothetical protein
MNMKDKEQELGKPQIDKLIGKYEKQYDEMIVMDDYDGGRKESLRVVIEDLKSSRWWTM